jgi:hypothetical protein
MIQSFYYFTVTFLLLVWILVLLRTAKGIFFGKIFAPAH